MKELIKKLLKNIFLQFVLGFAISVCFIAVLMWGIDWHIWNNNAINSAIMMGGVYVCSFWSIRRFTSHIGVLTFRYVIPIFSFWGILFTSFIFIFRFEYSVWYLMVSSVVSLTLLILFDYINQINKQKIIAYIPTKRTAELPAVPYVIWQKLDKIQPLTKQDVNIVMADLRADLSNEWQQFLADCTLKHIPVYHSSRLLERLTGRVKIDHMYENELGALLPSKSYQTIKRVLETSLILLSLPVVLPVMIITGLLIVIESRGGIFFLQERVGQGGKPFTVYKFRSMCKDSEKDGSQFAQANDMRVTRIGKFIRKTRIDELPQFFNVLKGEMSLIGPRPEQKKFVEEFNNKISFYNYRHIVKPGISGWAQVVQGYVADADDTKIKLEYDFYYIKNFSFSMDLLILFKTIQTMLTGFGAR